MSKQIINELNLGEKIKISIFLTKQGALFNASLPLFNIGKEKTYSLTAIFEKNFQGLGALSSDYLGQNWFFNNTFKVEEIYDNDILNIIKIIDVSNNELFFYSTDEENTFYSYKNHLKLVRTVSDNIEYKIYDKDENYVIYQKSFDYEYLNFSHSKHYKDSTIYNIDETGVTSLLYENVTDGPSVIFTKTGSLISHMQVFRTKTDVVNTDSVSENIYFTYTNNVLTSVKFVSENKIEDIYEFEYGTDFVTFANQKTDSKIKIVFDHNGYISSIINSLISDSENSKSITVSRVNGVFTFSSNNDFEKYYVDNNDHILFSFNQYGFINSKSYVKFKEEYYQKEISNSFLYLKSTVFNENLLTNGYFTNSLTDWSFQKISNNSTIEIIDSSLVDAFPLFAESVSAKISAALNEPNGVVLSTFIERNFTDQKFTLLGLIKSLKNIFVNNNFKIRITPYFNNIELNEIITYDECFDGGFTTHFFCKNVSFSQSVSKIKIEFIFPAYTSYEIGSICLLNQPFGAIYEYDNNFSICKTIENYKVSHIKSHSGVLTKFISPNYNAIAYSEVSNNEFKKRTIQKSASFAEHNYFRKNTGYLETTIKEYDGEEFKKRVKSHTQKNNYGLIIKNQDVNLLETNITHYKNTDWINTAITKNKKETHSYSNFSVQNRFLFNEVSQYLSSESFDVHGNVKTLVENNLLPYNLIYDAQNINVLQEKYGNNIMTQYTYQDCTYSVGKVISSIYINNDYLYTKIYDNKDRLSSIKGNNTSLFTFIYDTLDRNSTIIGTQANYNESFSYNYDGSLSFISHNRSSNQYKEVFDYSKTELLSRGHYFNNELIKKEYSSLNNNLASSLANSIYNKMLSQDKYYFCMFETTYFPYDNEDASKCYKNFRMVKNYFKTEDYIDPIDSEEFPLPNHLYIHNFSNTDFYFFSLSVARKLYYKYVVPTYDELNGSTVAFSFRKSFNSNQDIFLLRYNFNGTILCLRTSDNGSKLYACLNGLPFSTWILLGNINDGEFHNVSASIKINKSTNTYFFEIIYDSKVYNFSENTIYGRNNLEISFQFYLKEYDTDVAPDTAIQLTGLIFNPTENILLKDVIEHFNRVKKILFISHFSKENNDYIGKIAAKTEYFSENYDYELIEFKNSFTSNNGLLPYYIKNPEEAFIYSEGIFNNAYIPFNSEIIYKTNLTTEGTISMRAKIYDTEKDSPYFYLSGNSMNLRVLYKAETSSIVAVCDDVELTLLNVNPITLNKSHKLFFTYNITVTNIYITLGINDTVAVNSFNFGTYKHNINDPFDLVLGVDSSSITIQTSNELESYHDKYFNGAIENLIFKNSIVSKSSFIDNYHKSLVSEIKYDVFERLYRETIYDGDQPILKKEYSYNEYDDYTPFVERKDFEGTLLTKEAILINSESDDFESNLSYEMNYTYDDYHRISTYKIIRNSTTTQTAYQMNSNFSYDSCNQLSQALIEFIDDNIVKSCDRYQYNYNNGDIQSIIITDKNNFSRTINFTYSSSIKHQLIGYDGNAITYNGLYPYQIRNSSGSLLKQFDFRGTKLETLYSSGSTYNFVYDHNGKRIKKIINAGQKTIEFYYDSDNKLIREVNQGYILDFLYDAKGQIIGFDYKNTINQRLGRFYYVKNALNDIIEIIDENRNVICTYVYDAFGNHTYYATANDIYNLSIKNPYRYRGYYYDVETQLFYCNSRYYSPELYRWISPDSIEYLDPENINGLNLYCYCFNNPIMYADPSGHFAIISFLIGLGISVAIGAISGGVSYAVSELVSYAFTGEFSWSWASFAGSVLGGAIGGALAAIPVVNAMVVAGVSGFASTAIGMGLENAWEGKDYTFEQIMFVSTINGLISSAAGGLSEAIPIKGLTSGRGSYSAITKQITTKFFNGTIKRITYNTFSKMLTYNMLGGMIGAGVSGVMDATGANDWMANWFHQRTGF